MDKARALVEALPCIQRFGGKYVVIKLGGHAMVDSSLKRAFATDVIFLRTVGIRPVVVHGGGPQIGEMLRRVGKESRFFRGMRITDDETMEVVEMVLAGKINKEIVSLINREGGRAVGLSGKDGLLLRARKLDVRALLGPGEVTELVDLGKVGEVERVNPSVLRSLEEDGFIPVVAPIGAGPGEESYNINADLVASALAAALRSENLILLTDVEGVLDPDGNLISVMDCAEARRVLREGSVSGGMIPKLRCCIQAVEEGVRKAHIIDGRKEHAVLVELLGGGAMGTQIISGSHGSSVRD